MNQALENLDIQYTYHVHEGSAGTTANGCYFMPVYHQHIDTCYTLIRGYYRVSGNGYGGVWLECDLCGRKESGGEGSSLKNQRCYNGCQENRLTCTRTGVIERYSLGCGKNENTIESATIIF